MGVINFPSRVLSLNNDEVEEIELGGFDGNKQTTFCANVCYKQIVQVRVFTCNKHAFTLTF